ncbi:50S ribosomal protein L1 [Pontiella sulfatireligans]|uniref:Large ribosomal subunit protein uL1 n=1 Tax=Pontiella sulfatireligans TaxID=2750658 RepID=A0A6C2UJZ9_9BACT|nr:50S ribosomal protein L1 [Pontiella sulfatireligans]VGO20560.1 50S ribosomal protein L1 [Pontiella sulfatireligans]
MAIHGKKYINVAEKVDRESDYSVDGAIVFLQEHPTAKFDETMELAFRMGVDPSKSDQAIRSTVALPHGTGKDVRIIVFATGDAAEAAREAGATEVGFDDLIKKVQGGWTDFDAAVATPDAMKEVRKVARVLGPRGLMPNPKTGTVTDDTAAAVSQLKAGRVEFRMDRNGNIAVPFGKRSFEKTALLENAKAVVDAINGARPASAKGTYIKRCSISSTMGPGLRVALKEISA